MDLPAARRVVCADRQEGDFSRQPLTDLGKPREISAVAAVKDRSCAKSQMITAKPSVVIVDDASTPVMTRCERNGDLANVQRFPWIKLVDLVESEIGNEASNSPWDDNRLQSSDLAKGPPVQMIEMSMCYEDQIDRG